MLLDEDEDQIFPEYRSLIAIHAGKPKGGIADSFIDINTVRRLSLSEQELENAVKTYGAAIIRWLNIFVTYCWNNLLSLSLSLGHKTTPVRSLPIQNQIF